MRTPSNRTSDLHHLAASARQAVLIAPLLFGRTLPLGIRLSCSVAPFHIDFDPSVFNSRVFQLDWPSVLLCKMQP